MGLPALSRVIIAWEDAREKNKSLSSEEIERIRIDAEMSFPVPDKARAVIEHQTLDLLWENLSIAQERLIVALTDPVKSNQDKDKEIKIASSAICTELKRIKSLNGGQLPDNNLEKIWVSHGCDHCNI